METGFGTAPLLKLKAIRLQRQIRLPGLSRAGKYAKERDVVAGIFKNPRRKGVPKSGCAGLDARVETLRQGL
jgi:hypothetical protein